ncbi:hypothetical protein SLE2022_253020 [Rubroshorea leprosula]
MTIVTSLRWNIVLYGSTCTLDPYPLLSPLADAHEHHLHWPKLAEKMLMKDPYYMVPMYYILILFSIPTLGYTFDLLI